jgi:hypothetical protein
MVCSLPTNEYIGSEVPSGLSALGVEGEAGQSPALSRNCSNGVSVVR